MIFDITQATFFVDVVDGRLPDSQHCVRIENPDLHTDPCPAIAEILTQKEADAITEILNVAVGKIQAVKQGFYGKE